MSASTSRRVIFLDRDGTINHDPGYISNPDDLHLLPGAAEGIKLLQGHAFIVVVTNQSGISRGFYTPDDVARVHQHLLDLLAQEGARVDAIYYSPYQKSDGMPCRKPNPGMLLQAAKEHGLDLSTSWMIGDRSSDIEAGAAVGARTILLPEPHDAPLLVKEPDFRAESLLEAARLIQQIEGWATDEEGHKS